MQYQLEFSAGGEWRPLNGYVYTCGTGDFSRLLDRVGLTLGQRLRRTDEPATFEYDLIRQTFVPRRS